MKITRRGTRQKYTRTSGSDCGHRGCKNDKQVRTTKVDHWLPRDMLRALVKLQEAQEAIDMLLQGGQ